MASDRATLDQARVIRQIAAELEEMHANLDRCEDSHRVRVVRTSIWRCEGLVTQLKMAKVGEG